MPVPDIALYRFYIIFSLCCPQLRGLSVFQEAKRENDCRDVCKAVRRYPDESWQSNPQCSTTRTCPDHSMRNSGSPMDGITDDYLETEICEDLHFATFHQYLNYSKYKNYTQTFQKVRNRKVYPFSAWFERRPLADGPCIRILAAGWKASFHVIGDMYCMFWYTDHPHPVQGGLVDYRRIYDSTMWPKEFVAHFLVCKFPSDVSVLPFAVSIVDVKCSTPTNFFTIQNLDQPPEPQSGFAVCFPAFHNKYSDWLNILEWIELNKILGATEFTFYNLSMSADVNDLLLSYINDPEENINVIDWRIPKEVLSDNCYFIQRLAINDCIYRMMYKQKYVAVQDIDEIITPRKYFTWNELFVDIADPQVGIYMFQHSYFSREDTKPSHLITQTSFKTTSKVEPPGKIRCKSMYNAIRVVSADIHYHYILTHGSKQYMVDPKKAMLHHYRSHPMEFVRKKPYLVNRIDTHILRYKERLIIALKKKLTTLKSHKTFGRFKLPTN